MLSRLFPKQDERGVIIEPKAVAVALPLTLRERLLRLNWTMSWSFLAGSATSAATRIEPAVSEKCDVDKDLTVLGCYGPHIF